MHISNHSQTIFAKRDEYRVKIRREVKAQDLAIKRQRNIKRLEQIANQHIPSDYISITLQLNENQDNDSLLYYLLNNLNTVRMDIENCSPNNYGYFSLIFEFLFEFQGLDAQHMPLLLDCFQILLEKGVIFLNGNKEQYLRIVAPALGIIDSGIQLLLHNLSDRSISYVELILYDFFKSYDKEWQSQQILEFGLKILNKIMTIDTEVKQIKSVTDELVQLKRKKMRLIKYLFYQKAIFMETMLDILQNVHYSFPNDHIRLIVLKIFIRLTFWAEAKQFIKPLIDNNIYQSVRSFIDQQHSLEMNSLLMTLLQNLLALDEQISNRAFEDGIVEKLLVDLFNSQKNINKNAHVKCLSNFILGIDLQNMDVRDQIDNKHNLIELLESGIDNQSQICLLSAIYYMVSQLDIIIDTSNINILYRVMQTSQNTDISNKVHAIIQVSDCHAEMQSI